MDYSLICIIAIILLEFCTKSWCIMCYECVSVSHPGCGFPFNPWRFLPTICKSNVKKCAVQIQYPKRENDWITATQRGCYRPDHVAGLNTTDGCREFTNGLYTATYCFCSADHCNAAADWTTTSVTNTIFLASLLLIMSFP
ncbi:uncharacterized protein LOC141912854 [Tubulanus polymorphus]|uniref:uncharacterized protein LOC141912854 n=1 Tax=Tubulanus polymorphus TaxID=672921 RepID=UPI003DA2FAAA